MNFVLQSAIIKEINYGEHSKTETKKRYALLILVSISTVLIGAFSIKL